MTREAQSAASRMGPAPADAVIHALWPAWKKVLAYGVLAGLAGAAIWYVDLKAHRRPAAAQQQDLTRQR